MTPLVAGLLLASGVVALADWRAVWLERRSLEYLLKPLTLLLLIGVALALEPSSPSLRGYFVVGLCFSLVGDVFLMFGARHFLAGLVAFLIAHLFYVAGLMQETSSAGLRAWGALLALGALGALGPRLLRGARQRHRLLPLPMTLYALVLTLMLVFAFGTSKIPAMAGALLFFVSDTVLGWNAFVKALPWGRLLIISTYHLAQGLLVVSLI